MTTDPVSDQQFRQGHAAALVLACIAAMGFVLLNQLAQDDLPIILQNPAVQHPSLAVFGQAYWPPGFSPDLYRPFGTLTLALQWHLSAEQPWVIHAVSLFLYTALTLAVWALSCRLLPSSAAFVAALLFAVHPVHVEAVAVGVNQGELMVALVLVLSTISYIDARRANDLSARRVISMLLAFVVACLFKEHAVVLPALLLVAEFTVLGQLPLAGEARRMVVRLIIWLAFLAVVFLFVRALVLQNFAGTFSAEAFYGLGTGERVITMLGVVPIWTRLLLWPAHLQADYSPGEILGTTSMGPTQWLGLFLLILSVASIAILWRRAPTWSFGMLWAAITLAPVSNILIVTGIVVAERTLLLPSVGLVLAAGTAYAGMMRVMNRERTPTKRLALALLGLLMMLGLMRSADRILIWKNQDRMWDQTLMDAPRSYRAHHYRAGFVRRLGHRGLAEEHYREAITLWPRGFGMLTELGDLYRENDMCEPAAFMYQQSLKIAPARSDSRLSLAVCLLWLGHYDAALRQARLGRAWGVSDEYYAQAIKVADSALKVGAPPRTVRMQSIPGSTATFIGVQPAARAAK